MPSSFDELRKNIPANKFYPPRMDPDHCLYRAHLVEDILHRQGANRKAIIIEAQAGQGKTTLVQQFLRRFQVSFAWYQVGREDRDPALLAMALLTCLMDAVPGFRSQSLELLLTGGKHPASNLDHIANTLLAELARHIKDDFVLVLDDLYLLNGAGQSSAFLRKIIESAPPRLRFFLTSRHPFCLDKGISPPAKHCLKLRNEDLSLGRKEIEELFRTVLNRPISSSQAETLRKITDGWIMGLLMLAVRLDSDESALETRDRLAPLVNEDLSSYFMEEVFHFVPGKYRNMLLQLSWLEDIPVDLAVRITGDANTRAKLQELMESNSFIKSVDEENETYRLHHLFRDALARIAKSELVGQKKPVLLTAADYYEDLDNFEAAMFCCAEAEALDRLEDLIRKHGVQFWVANREATLEAILTRLPSDVIRSRPWLSLFYGMVLMEKASQEAFAFLKTAKDGFVLRNDIAGELCALSQIAYFSFYKSVSFADGKKYLPRAVSLYTDLEDSIGDVWKMIIARNLAVSVFFFTSDFNRAINYSEIAYELAVAMGKVSCQMDLLVCRGYSCFFSGRDDQAQDLLERAVRLSTCPGIGDVSKLFLRIFEINFLEHIKDRINYHRLKKQLFQTIPPELHASTLAGPYILLWDSSMTVSQGKIETAESMLQEYFDSGRAKGSSHMFSQALQWHGYVLACLGRRQEALAKLEESARLRSEAEAPYFEGWHKLIAGSAYVQMGMKNKAELFLSEATKISTQFSNDNMIAVVHIQLGILAMTMNDHEKTLENLTMGLVLMRKNRLTNLRTITPTMWEEIIGFAVSAGIEKEHCREIARKVCGMAVTEEHRMIPLLEITTLGSFSLSLNGKVFCRLPDFTPAQREIFALLVAAPGLEVEQSAVELALWPDHPPEKSRSNFDSQLSRLRKKLDAAIRPFSIKDYLQLKSGVLALNNCRVDAREFIDASRAGLSLAAAEKNWQAENRFADALRLWQGKFAFDCLSGRQDSTFSETLSRLFKEASIAWSRILFEKQYRREGERVIEQAMQYAPADLDLARFLYKEKKKQGGRRIISFLQKLRNSLAEESYDADEIEEMICCVTEEVA